MLERLVSDASEIVNGGDRHSTSPSSSLMISPAQKVLLKRALRVGHGDDAAPRVQRVAIRELCSSAQVCSLTPEQFVISMKATLNEVADEARLPFGRERDDLLFTLLRISIEEFFHAGTDGSGEAEADGLAQRRGTR